MEFAELQELLRDTGRDGLLAYDSLHDPRARPNAYCAGSWNVYRRDDVVLVSRHEADWTLPDGAEPPVWEFPDDASAYEFVMQRVFAECPAGSVRSRRWTDLPPRLRQWLADCGWTGATALFGNPLLATRATTSWRMLETPDGVELRPFDHRVPKNVRYVVDQDPAVLVAYLIVKTGPPPGLRRFGWPRVGVPLPADGSIPELLRSTTLDELADAYTDRDGGGLLSVLAHGVRLDLVSGKLRAAARRAGLSLLPFGDGESATFQINAAELFELSHRDGVYRLTYLGERGNRRLIAESDDLATVQARAVAEFDPR